MSGLDHVAAIATIRALTTPAERDDAIMARARETGRSAAWILAEVEQRVPAPRDGAPRVYTLDQLLADPTLTAPPEQVAARLAFAGRVSLLVAPPKAGKSTFAGAAAAAVSAGGSFLGMPTTAGRVLLVALDEHIGEIVRRLPRFQADPSRVLVVDHLGADGTDAVAGLIVNAGPRLVVIDALYRLGEIAGIVDPGRSSEWPRIIDPIVDATRSSDCATLLLHHARRSDGKYRDSSTIAAAVDAVIEIHTSSDPRERDIRTEARWTAEPFRLRLVGDLAAEGESLAYEVVGGHDLSLDARIIAHVLEHPGCAVRDVRDGVQGRGTDIDAERAQLLARGVIEDRGSTSKAALFVAGSEGAGHAPRHARVSGGNPMGHATDTVGTRSGTRSRVPIPGLWDTDRDTLPAEGEL